MKALRLFRFRAAMASILRTARFTFAAKRFSFISTIFLSGLLAGAAPGYASDGTITFTGKISENTCAVRGGTGINDGSTPTLAVRLPTIGTASLDSPGAVDGKTPFNVIVSSYGTTPNPNNVALFWETGPTTDPATHALRNAEIDNPNVQIQLLNASGMPMLVDGNSAASENSTAVPITNGGATLNYFAQYYATGPANAGAVTSSVTFSIVYQ